MWALILFGLVCFGVGVVAGIVALVWWVSRGMFKNWPY